MGESRCPEHRDGARIERTGVPEYEGRQQCGLVGGQYSSCHLDKSIANTIGRPVNWRAIDNPGLSCGVECRDSQVTAGGARDHRTQLHRVTDRHRTQ